MIYPLVHSVFADAELGRNSGHALPFDGADQVGCVVHHAAIKPRVDEDVNPRCVATIHFQANNQPMVKRYGSSNIGPLIAQRLKEKKKTYAWLAEEVGVSINAVSKWIHTGQITLENAILAARKLEISSGELMDCIYKQTHILQETQGVYEITGTNIITAKESRILSAFRQLDTVRQDECIAYVEERLQLQKLNYKNKRIS